MCSVTISVHHRICQRDSNQEVATERWGFQTLLYHSLPVTLNGSQTRQTSVFSSGRREGLAHIRSKYLVLKPNKMCHEPPPQSAVK